MAEKWLEWWRLTAIALMMGAILFVVLRSSQTGYLIVQVLILFGVLFCGYRFGPGAGAIAGCISGIVLAMLSREITQMGILCLLGVFSGAFRSLGRMASVTAYTAAAFGVGILYSPVLLIPTMESVLAGAGVFLLLPKKLTQPQEEAQPGVTSGESCVPLQSSRQETEEQLVRLAQTFALLGDMYNGQALAEKLHREEAQPDWKECYRELRLLLSRQLYECSEILQENAGNREREVQLSDQTRRNLEHQLARAGVSMGDVRMIRRRDDRCELRVVLTARGSRCISAKLVCQRISDAIGKNMAAPGNQPVLITSQPRWLRFEEECAFYTLVGASGSTAEGNDISGDSFSCLGLPGGKQVLFLCDGMGCGSRAGLESSQITELAEQMCRAGFAASTIVRLINNALLIQAREHPLTIDMTVIDCANGLCELTKSGAAATFLKREDQVEIIGADTMPAGILEENAPMEKMLQLKDGDILIMVSDGVLEELPVIDKEEALGRFCRSLSSRNPREIAGRILKYAKKSGNARDDMTVLVAGIWRKWYDQKEK